MKKLLPLIIVIGLVGCNQKKGKKPLQMAGVYSMSKQTLNDGTKDTTYSRNQLKIYTNHHMMYSSPDLTDSLANYGVGTYRVEDGKVIENLLFTSGNRDKNDSAILKVEKTKKGYRQVIENMVIQNKKYTITENYEAIGDSITTPLDGIWKQIKRIYINKKGDTLIDNKLIQFKAYQSGYFIWANTSYDSLTHKNQSSFGYGTFEMDGNNASKETNINSTYSSMLVGKPVSLELEFLGKDSYKQTIVSSTGGKSIEIYKRLE